MRIEIYTDGGYRSGRAVWAYMRTDPLNEWTQRCGPVPGEQTSQRAELYAAIAALSDIRHFPQYVAYIYSDSQYLVSGMNEWLRNWVRKGWRTSQRRPVENQDLWRELMKLTRDSEVREVNWIWIRRGSHEYNKHVDQLCEELLCQQS